MIHEQYILEHFRDAIENCCIQPYFQPVFRSVTGKVCSAEALARWKDPQYGIIPPGNFIPVLESHNLICDLDLEILRQTCMFYRELSERGTLLHSFSVNLSRYDFGYSDLFERITGILREYNVPPSAIKLEITESIMLEDIDTFRIIFDQFHDAGFSIWIDDFGSAYSSLNVLQNYDFDVIKFDMLFLRNFTGKSRQVLASLINMAKSLNIHTLVEGIETEEQEVFLRSVGCEIMQGFHFSKPLPGEEMLKSIEQNVFILESPEDRSYWNRIGRLNFLSPNPLEEFGTAQSDSSAFDCTLCADGAPLALLECSQHRAFYVYVSSAYMKRVYELGYPSVEALEHAFNDKQSDQYLMMKKMVLDAVSTGTVQEVDYVNNDVYYKVSARCIARKEDRAMLAMQLRIFDTEREIKTAREMLQYGNALFSTYEVVTLLYPDRSSASRIYAADSIPSYDQAGSLDESIHNFCESEIVPEEQEKYLRFFDLRTLAERIGESPRGFIQDVFRMKRYAGGTPWRSIRISKVPSSEETVFIYTIQTLHSKEKKLLDFIQKEHPEVLE